MSTRKLLGSLCRETASCRLKLTTATLVAGLSRGTLRTTLDRPLKKLYGLTLSDKAQVNQLLARLQIGDKTRLTDGAFSTTQLSTGQRNPS